jgi:hypothetical protein
LPESSQHTWQQVDADGDVDLYVNGDGDTATCDYAPIGGSGPRRMVTVRGRSGPPNLLTLAQAASQLAPGAPMIYAPARFFGGDCDTRVAIETTDTTLGEVWIAAIAGDDRA